MCVYLTIVISRNSSGCWIGGRSECSLIVFIHVLFGCFVLAATAEGKRGEADLTKWLPVVDVILGLAC